MIVPSRVVNYVAGFLFDADGRRVALIEKQKPEWQRGKLNGIGGKIEEGEAAMDAIEREFEEETGVRIHAWREFCVLKFRGAVIHFFAATGNVDACETREGEPVRIVETAEIRSLDTIPNLRWLVPMAMDKDRVTAVVEDWS